MTYGGERGNGNLGVGRASPHDFLTLIGEAERGRSAYGGAMGRARSGRRFLRFAFGFSRNDSARGERRLVGWVLDPRGFSACGNGMGMACSFGWLGETKVVGRSDLVDARVENP